jgi:Family of unknown function (DUF6498)
VNTEPATQRSRWLGAWPDALAFVAGLAIAGLAGWDTGDLVWSLWLSSLVVGYSMIVWSIFSNTWGRAGQMVGGLFLLAFFTVHFGMFHFVHSMFLAQFFPLDGVRGGDAPDYIEVVARYGIWLPVAFFAERAAFKRPPPRVATTTSVKAADIAARKANDGGVMMMKPYINVVRLHLLIFFFAGAHAMGWESFAVYAVVYAVYFFPWRLLGKAKAEKAK